MVEFAGKDTDTKMKALAKLADVSSRLWCFSIHMAQWMALASKPKTWGKAVPGDDLQHPHVQAWTSDPKSEDKLVTALTSGIVDRFHWGGKQRSKRRLGDDGSEGEERQLQRKRAVRGGKDSSGEEDKKKKKTKKGSKDKKRKSSSSSSSSDHKKGKKSKKASKKKSSTSSSPSVSSAAKKDKKTPKKDDKKQTTTKASILKVRRAHNVSEKGEFVFSEKDLVDEVEVKQDDSLKDCLGRLLKTAGIEAEEALQQMVARSLFLPSDGKVEKAKTVPVDMETPANAVKEVVLVRKGG